MNYFEAVGAMLALAVSPPILIILLLLSGFALVIVTIVALKAAYGFREAAIITSVALVLMFLVILPLIVVIGSNASPSGSWAVAA